MSGYIYDGDGKPIKDAYIVALNWKEKIWNPDKLHFDYFHNWIHSFSDTDGFFEIIPYNYITVGDDKIIFIKGSATGAKTFELGQSWPWTDIQMQTNVDTINLLRSNFQNTTYVTGQIVATGSIVPPFIGGMSLNVSNSTVNGTADFTAREEINLSTEFSASYRSEVHIFTSETFPDCIDYDSMLIQKQGNFATAINEYYDNNIKEIMISFRTSDNTITIFPNPSSGIFSIKLNSKSENEVITLIKVYNTLGKDIYFSSINSKSYQLDLSSYPKGIYFILINDSEQAYYQRLIIK